MDSRPSDTFQPGDLLNNTYRIEIVLGRGGTSEVYRARSEISGRVVALKVLNAEFSSNEDFLVLMTREEEIRDVRHDAVVRYSENNKTPDGHIYLVMDYVDGPGLDKVLAERQLSVDELMTIAERVLGGLVATHARNIVHRDMSPDNIILRGGKASGAVIIDFGIARDTNPGAATIVGDGFAGKYAYAAPEQLNGNADQRSDLYSVGATLLAAYRGSAPAQNSSLMDIVRAKEKPLDTEGVPEPLKSLIECLTEPDAEDRPQTASEALAQFGLSGGDTPAPQTRVETIGLGSERSRTQVQPKPKAGGGSSLTLVFSLLGLLVIGGATGAYFLGLLDPLIAGSYPTANPYTLTVEKVEGGTPELKGHAPSTEVEASFEVAMSDLGGTAEISLASGELPDGWGAGVVELLSRIDDLPEWSLALQSGSFDISGIVADKAARDRLQSAFAPDALPDGFSGVIDFMIGPKVLPVADVRELLDTHDDCGPLNLVNPPFAGYPLGDRVVVGGVVASRSAAQDIYDSIAAIAGDRLVIINADILSPDLCLIESRLGPLAAAASGENSFGDDAIQFFDGKTGEFNVEGRFAPGDNPVIELLLPDDMTEGGIWVTIVDVTGNAFHILPNNNRPEHSVQELRGGLPGTVRVRLTYPLADANGQNKLAFTVDETTGKSTILVFHTREPLFDTARPTIESVAGFAKALSERVEAGDVDLISLTRRVLVTE
jgi:eukaryotic-like serine/threonine-protein kinase